jgi:3-deoxy-D-manno-octulosonic-acid transferase
MYRWLYNLGIWGYKQAISFAAAFNQKAKAWIGGRRNIWDKLNQEIDTSEPLIWLHAASLGEAEQGVPIMQELKQRYPKHRILLSFFSPSGMQNFNQPQLTDYVCYLPADLPGNAKRFIDLVRPNLAIFIKYEIWANYFLALQEQNIPVMIAPAIFRPDHFYFRKPHSHFFVPILKRVAAILTQDDRSVEILKTHGVNNCKKVGDSRFERVKLNAGEEFSDPILEGFSKDTLVMVCGSTWAPDEEILIALATAVPQLKMILAPHDISPQNVKRVQRSFGKQNTFIYSQPPAEYVNQRFVVIDNIGMLSKLYRLGHIAYIGGAFGQGIHNSLEAVVYGMPVFFGPRHLNFIEPSAMLQRGFGHEVGSAEDLISGVKNLMNNPDQMEHQAQSALSYINEGTGATNKIMGEIQKLLG